MRAAAAAVRGARAARARAPPLLLFLLAASLARPSACSNVFTRMFPGGDRGVHGLAGPHGRHGHSAVSTGRHVTFFGGRSDFRNGDFLNDVWVRLSPNYGARGRKRGI